MGEIPSMTFSQMKLWLVLAAVTAVPLFAFGEFPQAPPAQTGNSPTQQVSAPERRTLALKELPVQQQADLLMARGEYVAAIAAYQHSNLQSALVWNSIGIAYHHLFALDEARKAYQTALTINPHFSAAANNLAAVFYAQRDFSQAEHWYKRALKHSSENAVIYCNLGTAYFAESKYKKG